MCTDPFSFLKQKEQNASPQNEIFFLSLSLFPRHHGDTSLLLYKSDIRTPEARQTHSSLHAHAVQRAGV